MVQCVCQSFLVSPHLASMSRRSAWLREPARYRIGVIFHSNSQLTLIDLCGRSAYPVCQHPFICTIFCITFQSYLNHKCCHQSSLPLSQAQSSISTLRKCNAEEHISLLHTLSTKHEPSSIGIQSTSSGDMKSECAAPENGCNILAGTDKLSKSTNKVWLCKFCNQHGIPTKVVYLDMSVWLIRKIKGTLGCSICFKR